MDKSTVSGSDQHVYDMIGSWKSVWPFISRSGQQKVNHYLFGTYITSMAIAMNGKIDGPWIQLARDGLRIAGQYIDVVWETPWRVAWSNIDIKHAHPNWSSGYITFKCDSMQAQARVTSPEGKTNIWSLFKARIVGGPGGISIFSKKRQIKHKPGQVKSLPFPPTNREDYRLALKPIQKTHKTRRSYDNWECIFRGGRYSRIVNFFKRERIVAEACLEECFNPINDNRALSDEQLACILSKHRLPNPLILDESDLITEARGTMWWQEISGRIVEVFEDDPPIIEGEVKHLAIRDYVSKHSSWLNQELFDMLDRAWKRPASHRSRQIILRPYTKALYSHFWDWHRQLLKTTGLNAEYKIFSVPILDQLKSFPYAVALRSMVPKPGVDEWRQVVNHTACVNESTGPNNTRTSDSSLNERIKDVMVGDPNLEMTKGADLGMAIAIYQDAGFDVIIVTVDAKHYYHAFSSDNRTAFEQGTLTIDGPTVSHRLDMGRTNSGLDTGQVSDLNANLIGEHIESKVQHDWIKKNMCNSHILKFRSDRADIYGQNSKQTWIAYPMQFSDDVVIPAILVDGMHESIIHSVKHIGDMMGIQWEEDKYGANIHIGYEFRHNIPHPTQHIKSSKIIEYAEKWDAFIEVDTHTLKEGDSMSGQLNHAATIDMDIKPLAKSVTKARHAKNTRFDTPVFRIFDQVKLDIANATKILRRNKGIPMMCDFTMPDHRDLNTLTQRGDACLNESDGYNGFGSWYFAPCVSGHKIVALMDKWTIEEEILLGRNIPAAEALTALIGKRALLELGLLKGYDYYLTLTDSETTFNKFSSMRMGSDELDAIRDAWLQPIETSNAVSVIDYIPREFNVLSDLLSKNKREAFRECILAMGLPEPIFVDIPPKARDWSDLHHAFK